MDGEGEGAAGQPIRAAMAGEGGACGPYNTACRFNYHFFFNLPESFSYWNLNSLTQFLSFY